MRAVSGTAAIRIAGMLALFGTGVQLARLLGVEGYGYYGMALAIITVAGIPGEMGLPRLVTREIAAAKSRNDMPKLFGVLAWANAWTVRIAAIMVALVAALALLMSLKGFGTIPKALLWGLPIIPLFAMTRTRGGALQGLDHILLGQVPDTIVRPFTFMTLLALAAVFGITLKAPGAMALNAATTALAFVVARQWLRKRLPDARPAEIIRNGRQWLRSSVPMAMTDGMRVLQAEGSMLLLGILTAPVEVGLFRIANVTAFAAALPVTIINFVAFPVVARLFAEGDMPRLQKAITRLAQAQFAGVLLLCAPLLIFPEPLLALVFGQDFGRAAPALRILAGSQIACAALGASVALLNMTHQERRVTRAMSVALAVNFALVLILSARWGNLGAAVAFAVGLFIWNIQTWRDARRLLGIETSIFAWGPPTRPSDGPKPNLFIVGAPKCGTTAWARYLGSHPDIFITEVKETSRFADDLPGMQWVKSEDDYLRLFERGRGRAVIGDPSAAHLFSTVAAEKIAAYNPSAKILIFLRKQEDYLPALHNHFLSRYEECIQDFSEAWRVSEARPPETILPSFTEPRLLNYKAMGRFHEQVARYCAAFPADQIRVIHIQDWVGNPRATYLQILDFLGLKDDGRTEFPPVNEARYFRNKWVGRMLMHPPGWLRFGAAVVRKLLRRNALNMNEKLSSVFATKGYQTKPSPEVLAEIRDHYADDNARLAELLAEVTVRSRSAR